MPNGAQRDPIERTAHAARRAILPCPRSRLAAIEQRDAQSEVEAAVAFALASPEPDARLTR